VRSPLRTRPSSHRNPSPANLAVATANIHTPAPDARFPSLRPPAAPTPRARARCGYRGGDRIARGDRLRAGRAPRVREPRRRPLLHVEPEPRWAPGNRRPDPGLPLLRSPLGAAHIDLP